MKPPKLAIVTSLCKGNTLYTHLHLRKDKFYMNKVIIIGQQIAQGMGYLHHKGIVHKDLKTKNIFLENGRAIITDFGLVNVARRLCSRHKRPGEKGEQGEKLETRGVDSPLQAEIPTRFQDVADVQRNALKHLWVHLVFDLASATHSYL